MQKREDIPFTGDLYHYKKFSCRVVFSEKVGRGPTIEDWGQAFHIPTVGGIVQYLALARQIPSRHSKRDLDSCHVLSRET